jgi:hypothetical protein
MTKGCVGQSIPKHPPRNPRVPAVLGERLLVPEPVRRRSVGQLGLPLAYRNAARQNGVGVIRVRIASRVIVVLSLGLLAACGSSRPSETVVLSQRQSAFDTPLDGRWRKAHETRPIAILLGRAETTRILAPRQAALEASCYRGRPRVRVAYDVGLRTGPIAVAYRFDAKIDQKGVVRVRGRHRNILVIDYQPTATAFLAELRTSDTLKVRATRPPFELHDALFRWDREDKALKDILAACQTRMLDAGRRKQPSSDPDDDDGPLDDAIKDVLPEQ